MVQLSVKDVTRESKVHLLGKPFKILLICFVYFFVICTFFRLLFRLVTQPLIQSLKKLLPSSSTILATRT